MGFSSTQEEDQQYALLLNGLYLATGEFCDI